MAIQSVTSSLLNAYSTSSTKTQQAPQQAQQQASAQAAERGEPPAQERVELQEEPQRPVTNALGQQVGTLINVTA